MATEKYTQEQEARLVHLYQSGTDVLELEQLFNKSRRSIIAKLSKLGVYESKNKISGPRLTKMQLVDELESMLELEPQTLHSVEKADRDTIVQLIAAVKARKF